VREASDTLASVLAWHASQRGDTPWLLFEDEPGSIRTVSWAEALERARRTATVLRAHGAGPGERVNVHLTNRPEFYDLWFAAAICGAVLVPTNPLLGPEELGYALEHARCRLSVTQGDLVQTVEQARASAPCTQAVLSIGPQWDRSVATADASGSDFNAAPDDVLSVLYTSGTTSRPKGVMVSHAAYLHAGEAVAQHVRLRPNDRQLVVLPLFHGNAQYYSSMSALVTGASVALAPRFSASRWSEQAERMGATVASLFAAPIRMILAAAPSPSDRGHRLRLALFAQNVTQAQLDNFEERFGCPLTQLYGMTETVAPPTINPVYGERRNLSIGRPTISARVRIDDGELLVAGEPGWTLMSGYLDDPEATAAVLRDGWLHTGDGVREDDDGYLYFVDRSKDLIKRAGENVSTVEVEQVLDQHPTVYESAVVGLPDAIYDEIVAAFVVPAAGASADADELIAWCAERLAKFKVPARVEFVSELPRTPVGKIQKHLIRAGAAPAG
jgi:crotonobetaine/carnitine-CoA ligase